KINYTGIEYFPVPEEIYVQLNYPELLVSQEKHHTFLELHHCEWGRSIALSDLFTLEKQQMKFEDIAFENRFDLIYFDAFGYRVQPELWSAEIFKKMFAALKNGGILTTYAARGVITRNMKEAGFIVKKTAGPIGHREMTVAYKVAEFNNKYAILFRKRFSFKSNTFLKLIYYGQNNVYLHQKSIGEREFRPATVLQRITKSTTIPITI